MDFSLTDEQELLLESIDEFAERYFDEDTIKAMYENHDCPDEIADAYRDAGFGYMGLPESVGGIDTDYLTLALMTERLYHKTGCMTPFMTAMLAMKDIADFGTEEQAAMIMERYEQSGRCVAALGISEPAAGSDNNGMTTCVVKQEDGTYVMNGQKTWVTNGAVAQFLLIIAKDESPAYENNKYSMWLIPADSEGVSIGYLDKVGQQAISFVDVFLDNVKMTEANRVGEAGKGFYLLMKNFEFERCLVVAQGLGEAQAAMDDAANYVSERVAFGKPLAANPLVRDLLVEAETILENVRTYLYKCCWMLDNGQSIRSEVAMLKRYATKGCTRVADIAMSVYGGLGYTNEVRIGRIWKDLRGNEFAGGAVEVMSYIAGREIVKKYKK
ncbi:MAG: acyl-CoA dehydrogenase family protein [Eggerthellales bacterium]|nr:acyl-CoA dehydrogenase family protein [Eggerthellales bacterium]